MRGKSSQTLAVLNVFDLFLNATMTYDHSASSRPIRVYRTMDSRFILEDLYAKLQQAHAAGVTD